MNCCQYIGKENDNYHCHTWDDCDFDKIMGYSYLLCSHCFYLSSMLSKSSSIEFIRFSIHTIKQNINKKKKINLYEINRRIPRIINNCLVYIEVF